jgi:hypothetical protein
VSRHPEALAGVGGLPWPSNNTFSSRLTIMLASSKHAAETPVPAIASREDGLRYRS